MLPNLFRLFVVLLVSDLNAKYLKLVLNILKIRNIPSLNDKFYIFEGNYLAEVEI